MLPRPGRGAWPWLLALGPVLAVLWAALSATGGIGGPPLQKGTWIWDAPAIIFERNDILDFSERNGITHIYLYANHPEVAPKHYAAFIKEATARGIEVEALGGDPTWGWKEKRPHLQALVEWVAGYNTNVEEDERFSGLHLDIEPYLLPEWQTERPRIVGEWLANLEFASLYARSAAELKLSADVPFWIDSIDVPGYDGLHAGSWVLKRFDTVVLMDYRDTADGQDGIVSNALALVREAEEKGKSVVVGVEMAPSGEAEKTTFHEEGHLVMERELEKTRKRLKQYSGFRGVAVHGFPDWMASHRKGE